MESRLQKIFSMGLNNMSSAVWLGEDRKCSAAVVGLDLVSQVRLNFMGRVSPVEKKVYVGSP